MDKLKKKMYWALIASETTHVFCCVLPVLFSVISLLTGFGLIAVMPGWLEGVHDLMHGWELPVIAVSGVILAFGWFLEEYSRRIDCHDTGCQHGKCDPRKDRAKAILKIATVLFVFNVLIYIGFHRGADASAPVLEVHGAVHTTENQ